MGFLYSLFLKLLYPTSLCLMLLIGSVAWRRRRKISRLLFWLAIAILMVCGNGWVVGGLTRHLERKCQPTQPVPKADCILVLSGGIWPKLPPRPTIEVGEAGDRLLYGCFLYREGRASKIICTGGVATGGIASRSASEDMAEFLTMLGVPNDAMVIESKASDTGEHARNLLPVFQQHGFKRILLVTSAMHMPRSLGAFQRQCPGIEFLPAPTDFRATDHESVPWYRQLSGIIPTPGHLLAFSEVMHEYMGIFYYRLRGWI